MKRFFPPELFLSVLILLMSGCEDRLSCLISGNNLQGRIIYGDVPIDTSFDVVIEYQYGTSFSSNMASSPQFTAQRNIHGLMTFEYSLCVANDRDVVVRAYEDLNRNQTLDAGEPHGIFDGTVNGDATPVTVNIPYSKTEWVKQKGVDFTIDSAQ